MFEEFKGRRVLFISTKNSDYIRNRQELKLLSESAGSVKCVMSGGKTYFSRLLRVWTKLPFISYKSYDVVFAGFAPQLYLPFLYKRIKKSGAYIIVDFFISLYDTFCYDRKTFKPGSAAGRFLLRLDKRTLEVADRIICDTKAQAEFFVSELGADKGKTVVLYLKADREIYNPRKYYASYVPDSVAEKKEVLYFGTGLPLQGTDTVIEAMNSLVPCGEYQCVFIGTVKKDMRKRMDKRIEYIKWLPQNKLAERIVHADICLAGHFNADIDKAKRTIPGKAFIYEAMGKPMILGDNGANREYFKETERVLFVPMGDPRALAERISFFAKTDS